MLKEGRLARVSFKPKVPWLNPINRARLAPKSAYLRNVGTLRKPDCFLAIFFPLNQKTL
jgi:hypothetical protein